MYFFIIHLSNNSTRKYSNLFFFVTYVTGIFFSIFGFNSLNDLTSSNFLQRLCLKNDILNELSYLYKVFTLPFCHLLFEPSRFMHQSLLNFPWGVFDWPYLISNMEDLDLQYSENYFLDIRYLKLRILYFLIPLLCLNLRVY